MKILKKGTLTIDGKDCELTGYEFDRQESSMLDTVIGILEEGVRDLQDQIAKARIEGLNITDGGGNTLNGETWEFPFGVAARPSEVIATDVRWVNNYSDETFRLNYIPFNPPSDPTAPLFKLILRQAAYFLLLMLVVGVGLAVLL